MSKSGWFWDRVAKSTEGQVKESDEEAIAILDHTRKYLQPDDILLDFACATGKYSFAIAPQVKEVWGIDISSEMVAAAKRNSLERGVVNVQFMRAEINGPQLEGKIFDVILALNILHLVEDPSQVVEKIMELLKPGGIFISVTPCLGAGGTFQASLIKLLSFLGIVPRVHAFKPDEVETLLTNANFELLETQAIPDFASNIFLAARRKK